MIITLFRFAIPLQRSVKINYGFTDIETELNPLKERLWSINSLGLNYMSILYHYSVFSEVLKPVIKLYHQLYTSYF